MFVKKRYNDKSDVGHQHSIVKTRLKELARQEAEIDSILRTKMETWNTVDIMNINKQERMIVEVGDLKSRIYRLYELLKTLQGEIDKLSELILSNNLD